MGRARGSVVPTDGNGQDSPGPRQIRTRVSVGRRESPASDLVPTLQVVDGPGVGRWHRFKPGERCSLTVGRTDEAQFVIEHATVSRCHARFTWLRMGPEFLMLLEDLESTNGTSVNGVKTQSTYLKQGDLVALGDVVIRFQLLSPSEVSERERLIAKASAAETDALTGLATRLYMEEALPQLCRECDARGLALSLLIIDLDHFKRVNDTFGHPVGDQVLAAVARVVMGSVRDSDVAVRFGGEEFLTFLPGTELRSCAIVAERVRAAVASFDASKIGEGLKLTVSIGAAERAPGEAIGEVLRRADQALYRAKTGGRDRVELDGEPAPAAAG